MHITNTMKKDNQTTNTLRTLHYTKRVTNPTITKFYLNTYL